MCCDPHFAMFKVEETLQGVRDDIQLHWMCSTVESYAYRAIAHRVGIFDVSCMEHK